MNKRLEKYSASLQITVAKILYEYQQPGTTVTVTNIQISPDLKQAQVWVSVFGKHADRVFESIEQNRGEISKLVAAQSSAKFSPHISFRRDEGGEDTRHIEELLYKN